MADITLHTTPLPGLVPDSGIAPSGVRASTAKTLSGGVVIWEQPEAAGRSFNLEGGSDYGWLTRSALLALQALADVPGATYTLAMTDGSTITVRFRNEDTPAIEARPIIPRPNPAADDWYSGVIIKLMEV